MNIAAERPAVAGRAVGSHEPQHKLRLAGQNSRIRTTKQGCQGTAPRISGSSGGGRLLPHSRQKAAVWPPLEILGYTFPARKLDVPFGSGCLLAPGAAHRALRLSANGADTRTDAIFALVDQVARAV